jgi:hypothetical protein
MEPATPPPPGADNFITSPPGELQREVEREIELLMTDDAVVGERLDELLANEETATPPPAGAGTTPPPLRRRVRTLSPTQRVRQSYLRREQRHDPARAEQNARIAQQDLARRRAKRAAVAAERRTLAADTLLERTLDASGSVITANSMRLRTLPAGPAREKAREDVKADIARYVHVDQETLAGCVSDYTAATAVGMRVCGACGLRDPMDGCSQEVDLTTLGTNHWLRVEPEAYERMQSLPEFTLLRRTESGYEGVAAHRTLLHNTHEIDGAVFHVVPEAVHADGVTVSVHAD